MKTDKFLQLSLFSFVGVIIGLLLVVGSYNILGKKKLWIMGSDEEKFTTIAKHLRGLDMAMVEVGYRYTELYFAGIEENWAYAEYQAKKIEKAVKNAIERRPKRAESMKSVFLPRLTIFRESLANRNKEIFLEQFGHLTKSCNKCHRQERVPTFVVNPPGRKLTPIGAQL